MTEPPPQPIPREWCAELERCHRDHAQRLFGHVFLLTKRDKQTTEDVVQDTFRAAAGNWGRLRRLGAESLAGWLFGAASNIAIDYFRRNERARRYQAEVWDRLYQASPQDTCHLALTEAALEHCWKVIERMPPRQHAAALLRWRCGYTYREISSILGMTEKTVSAHLSTARRTLIDEVGPYLPFDLDKPQKGGSQS
ncbi:MULTISPECIES: sigma-70 family RNA polymerase sigma factor [unclassified Streptomyces]|uniref:RNA polymerase sigma factor n=1 Tax=unclassified Streptomyces TaxID=2593676 RepID=UPI0023657D55|nr:MULTISPECIES: sigma-70 family RNA polymerase sigma factor [unclassified Streptomyces]MDF3147534.1 sigma-70 family RNA polymerase sigma factor [Streptomyces sp. T21Q-yed]WDF36470.1 sigma-70 family RNA polymerase sigma factor [Streptomyces sp. T12]